MLHRATGASYSFTVNPEQGIIIDPNRESPKWAGMEQKPPVALLPQLKQFSDVAWIKCKAHVAKSNTGIGNVKYFLPVSINNVDTQRVLKGALQGKGWGIGRVIRSRGVGLRRRLFWVRLRLEYVDDVSRHGCASIHF
jgi:hypothetical protein